MLNSAAKKPSGNHKIILLLALLVLLATAPIPAKGGGLTPPGAQDDESGAMETLDQIYYRLLYGTQSSPRGYGFIMPDSGPSPSLVDLNTIMAATPKQDPVNSASPSDVAAGKTFWGLGSDARWGLQTGTVACAGSALPYHVLEGKTFINDSGTLQTGTMPDKSNWSITPDFSLWTQTIEEGYHNGAGTIAGDNDLQPENIQYDVSIYGVTGNDPAIRNTSGCTAEAAHILQDKTAWVNGHLLTGTAEGTRIRTGTATESDVLTGITFSNSDQSGLTGTMPDNDAWSISPEFAQNKEDDQPITIPEGYHNGNGVIFTDSNLSAPNIVYGKTIYGVTGDYNVRNTSVPAAENPAEESHITEGKTAFVNGSKVTGTWTRQFPVEILKTGQTTSYAANDDGALQKGKSWSGEGRFTVNLNPDGTENGTVTDNLTGLVWLKNAGCYNSTWQYVLAKCNTLAHGDCGLSDGSAPGDWRLPNLNELLSLMDYGQSDPTLPEGHPFTNVSNNYYWTSTGSPVDDTKSIDVEMGTLFINDSGHIYSNFCWPVRDIQGNE